jgi:cytochrome P450
MISIMSRQPDEVSYVALFGIAAALLLIYQLGVYIYNIWFHPISKYPGPVLAAASRIPLVWRLAEGDSVAWTTQLHARYGDVVRVAPNELSYANSQAFKDIYGHRKAGQPSFLKDPRFYIDEYTAVDPTRPDTSGNTIISANDPDHSRMRRIFSHAFSDKALKQQEHIFMTYVDLLLSKMHETVSVNKDHEFDMVSWYNYTTFDVMGDLTFGEPLGLLEGSEYTPWVKGIYQHLRFGTLLRSVKYFPRLETALEKMLPTSLREKQKEHYQYSADRVTKRLEKGTTQPDIWNLILQKDESKGLSLKEMHTNSSIFMAAGTETTATALSGLTYYLLMNPDKMKKLTDEIRGAFSSDDDIHMEKLAQLKYMHACVEEGLRMYPPVPVGLPRWTPAAGAEICGQYVPPKTCVYVTQWSTYQNEKNFKDAYQFIPERWTDVEFASDDKSALQPFSVGPRNCLGKNMAYHEVRLILAKVLWHFDLHLCEESVKWADQKVWTLWDKGPLMCKTTPVKHASAL